MDIGEVAKKAKVTTATLRFYEEKGLIKSIGRQGLRRQYGKQVLDQLAKRLHFISQGLEHAAVCPAENHMECPTFQSFLKAAIAGEYQPTKL